MSSAPWAADDPVIYLVAVTLDHYYSAVESLIERIARAFEGLPDRTDRWHKELLEGAALRIAGTREPIIKRATHDGLLELLEFRQFMRHAYAVSLDPDRLHAPSHTMQRVHPLVIADTDEFIAALRA